MGDPVCYMHLLDEEGRMPDALVELPEGEEDAERPADAIVSDGQGRPPYTPRIPPGS
jgi:hypothetical protein